MYNLTYFLADMFSLYCFHIWVRIFVNYKIFNLCIESLNFKKYFTFDKAKQLIIYCNKSYSCPGIFISLKFCFIYFVNSRFLCRSLCWYIKGSVRFKCSFCRSTSFAQGNIFSFCCLYQKFDTGYNMYYNIYNPL